jgi:hypothetical protein
MDRYRTIPRCDSSRYAGCNQEAKCGALMSCVLP